MTEKEIRDGKNCALYPACGATAGGPSSVALQRWLGLLPKRRAGLGVTYRPDFGPSRPGINGHQRDR